MIKQSGFKRAFKMLYSYIKKLKKRIDTSL